MKVTLIPGQELSEDLIRIWARLHQTNPDLASPYFCPEFTKAIATVQSDIEVAILESTGKIDAFFPFQRESQRVGRPVGSVISDYHGLICERSFRFSPRELLEQSRLSVWDFDHLPVSQLDFAPFQSFIDPSPQIDISRGYDSYVQQQRKSGSEQIKKLYNLERRIERELGPLRFVAESSDAKCFTTLLNWKSGQYRLSGKPDLFAPGWIHEAVSRIFAMGAGDSLGVLSLLYAGDRLVAGHFGMRSHKVWHYWFPSYDPRAAKYSPGLILLLKMAKHAPTIGIELIDLGRGMSPYKERLMNSHTLLAGGSLELPSWRLLDMRIWRSLYSQLSNWAPWPPAHIAKLRRRARIVRSQTGP
jgi:CelD/BcsL family acetyltransferase involved in cellulose biosynthesis